MEYPLRQQQSASFAETGARNPANVASAPGAVEEQRHVPCFSTHFNFFCLFVFASQMEEQERPPSCRRGHFKAGDVRRSSKKKKHLMPRPQRDSFQLFWQHLRGRLPRRGVSVQRSFSCTRLCHNHRDTFEFQRSLFPRKVSKVTFIIK